MNNTDTETLWLAAFRYYAGRRTYAVSEFCALLIREWPTLPHHLRLLIERELDKWYALDDRARLERDSTWPLGDDCDRAEWDKVRALWQDQYYWLCCGSRNPQHNDKTCLEARAGYPERVRFGTANEHSAWSRGEL